jgi:hypothetical protein
VQPPRKEDWVSLYCTWKDQFFFKWTNYCK